MIELFIRRPAMTLMFVLVFVVLGIVSYLNLPIEMTPRVEFPLVVVKTVYPGASPDDIEIQILKKVEDVVAQIADIKEIQSRAYQDYGYVLVQFHIGANPDTKAAEVKDKVEAIINELPKQADKPLIMKIDPLQQPILDLVLTSDSVDDRTLFEFADKTLKNRISVIEGVASVDIYGGKRRQINVRLDALQMKKYYLSIKDVIDAIGNRNVSIPGGTYDRDTSEFLVRTYGEYQTLSDIASMKLVSKDGVTLRLSDVAVIEDSYKKVSSFSRFNQKDNVGMQIQKLPDANAIEIAKRIRAELPKLTNLLPSGVALEVATDTTVAISTNTNSTIMNIYIGVALTALLILLFLGSFRITLVSAVVIPTSIVSTFFLMDLSHFSINMMSLLAIATALGTLIANALIVIENIDVHFRKGKSPVQAAIDGTKEATIAVIGSAGTNLVVFTPIAFMGGIIGQFMQQFGLTVVYATIFSILASFSLTPMLCAFFLGAAKADKAGFQPTMQRFVDVVDGVLKWLVAEYQIIFNTLFRRPALALTMSIAALLASFALLPFIGGEFFPATDQGTIGITVQMPPGSNVHATRIAVSQMEASAAAIPEVLSVHSAVGNEMPEKAIITVNLKPLTDRSRSDKEIINQLIPEAAKLPDAEVAFARGHHGPEAADIDIDVYGVDYPLLIPLSEQMKQTMIETGYFRSVESSHKGMREEIRFIPNEDQMLHLGVTNSDAGSAVRAAINGNDYNLFKEAGQEYRINVEVAELYKQSAEDIGQLGIISKDGLVRLADLGSVESKPIIPGYIRRDKERVIRLSGNLQKSTADQVQRALRERFSKLKLPPGATYRYVGNAEFQQESQKETSRAFILACILTYMLLVATLNSFLTPLVIATTILSSFSGVFFALFFLGFSFNIATMMAMIMLVGLVVNNAILMLDHTERKRREGVVLKQALWLGASEKFRTILMTSIAVITGTIPQIFDPDGAKGSMGAVMTGGMLGSIVFTFLQVPLIYWYLDRARSFVAAKVGWSRL